MACLISTASCSDHKDLYNPDNETEKKKEEYNKNFPVPDIDPTQDWNAFTIAKVNVTVNEDWGETYVVKVYTDNPLDQDSNAMLLAKGEVKNGDTFSADIEIPKGLAGVYVSKTSSKGACVVKYAIRKDNRIMLTFGELAKERSVRSRGLLLNDQAREIPYSKESIEEYLQNASELPTGGLGWNSGIYKLTSNASYASLTMQASNNNGLWLIITDGATLTVKEGTMTNENVHLIIYNGILNIGKSFKATSVGPETVVYPQGKITGNGAFEITNNWGGDTDKMLYNAGTINVHALTVNGGSYYNCGITDVLEFHNTTNGGKLVNFGSVKIGDAYIQNMTIYNSCKMSMKTNNVSGSEFKDCYLADGAYLKVENTFKTGSNSNITLGNGAILDVGVYLSNNSSIHGVESSSGNAYIKFGKVEGQTFGKSTGYYTVDAGDCTSLSGWSKGKFEDNTLKISGATLGNLIIVSPFNDNDDCSGKASITPNDNKEEINAAIYAFEDLGSIGDYDFNDVVFKISHLKGSTEATAELLAAGGTMKVAVKYGSQVLWDEVHEAFGATPTTMVNTGRGSGTKKPEIKTITVPANASFNELIFSIVVTSSTDETKTGIVVSEPTTGEAPQCLCIPATWKWPKENVSIVNAYSTEGHSFGDWAGNATQANDWYNYPVSDKVYQ